MLSKQELKKNLYTSLQLLGLSEQEIELYIASLSLGPSSITKIAKVMNVARPNIYPLIKGLEKQELVKLGKQKKYERQFMVEPPTLVLQKVRELKQEVDDHEADLVSAMPDLLALYSQGERETNIKILKSREDHIKAFKQVIEESKGTIEFFGNADDFVNYVTWEVENQFIKSRMKNNIKIRILVLPGEITSQFQKKDKEQMRETRIYKGKFFNTSYQLFANKVIIWQPKAPLAVLIEDQYIVEMLKSMFYMLWKISK